MNLIDGKGIAERINEQTREKVARLRESGITPGLAVVLVGSDPASMAYVRTKDKTSQKLGLFSRKIELPDPMLRADERLVLNHRAQEIRAAIEKLSPKQQAAVLMHKYQGMDYAEIARALDCSIPALKSLLFRAYQTLRQRLAHFAPARVA